MNGEVREENAMAWNQCARTHDFQHQKTSSKATYRSGCGSMEMILLVTLSRISPTYMGTQTCVNVPRTTVCTRFMMPIATSWQGPRSKFLSGGGGGAKLDDIFFSTSSVMLLSGLKFTINKLRYHRLLCY